jgi:hypothetical protein
MDDYENWLDKMQELRIRRIKADLEGNSHEMNALVAEYENIGAFACAEFCRKKSEQFQERSQ